MAVPDDAQAAIDAFWAEYLRECGDPDRRYVEAFRFGNSERLANALPPLVLSGVKTATSTLLWEMEKNGAPVTRVGEYYIVLDWEGAPVCVIEITGVSVVPFDQVDEQFVYDYGEGERTLDWWNTRMWEYYARECRDLGREPARDMPVVCERFRVVYTRDA
jgi:uncharacterized protein YhfF